MKRITITIFILLFGEGLFAQIEHPVKWGYAAKRLNQSMAIVFLKATIEPGWHIYSAYQEDGGPVKTSFDFIKSNDYVLSGKIEEPVPIIKFENAFNMKVKFHENAAIFQQKIKLNTLDPVVKGKLTFMVCNDNKCLPPETIEFAIPVK